MRAVLIDALQKQYEADIAAADVTIKLILENSVGMSEHLNHQKELDCQLHKMAAAEEKLQVLKDYELLSPDRSLLSVEGLGILDLELTGPLDNLARFLTGPDLFGTVPELVHDFVEVFVDMLQSERGFVN